MAPPKHIPRRPFNDRHPKGLKESDKDYVSNNFELAVYLLEHQLTEFEQSVLRRVVNAASIDPSIALKDIGFSRHDVGACTRIMKKLT